MLCGLAKWGYSSPHSPQIDLKVGNINGLSVITDSIVGNVGSVEVGQGWQRWSRGREDRRSRGRATDTQRHSRGAQDEPGQPERLRQGRASPMPTGCTQSHPERPQGQGSPQGWTETPAATHSPSDAPQATTDCAGAQLPTHRAKRATAAQNDPQRVRHTPI